MTVKVFVFFMELGVPKDEQVREVGILITQVSEIDFDWVRLFQFRMIYCYLTLKLI